MSSLARRGAASQQPWRMANGAWSPPMTSTAARTKKILLESGGFLIHLESKFGVHIAAIVAGTVRELGVAALGATDIMNGFQRQMGPAFPLARFAVFLDRKHR